MTWPKQLSVDKRVVALLSASTYESFPRALRELVSNAYDADATRVEIDIDSDKETIRVVDNGSGMTPDEFDFYLRIAGRQRTRSRTTELGRSRIGQFGIGFLAMFPFCNEVRIESTVEGSTTAFRASIPAARFFSDSPRVEDVTAASVEGEEYSDERLRRRHYTRLTLVKTTHLVHRFVNAQPDRRRNPNSIRSWPGVKRLRWELQDILPIGFRADSEVAPHVAPQQQDFAVSLNGEPLLANDYVDEVLDHSPPEGATHGGVTFLYAIGTPWKAVAPDDARGLRVRLHRVGVGERVYFDLGTHGRTFSRLHWLTGEVNILEGLDEALTLNRDSFTATEGYDTLREFFRTKLRELAYFVEDVDVAKQRIRYQTTESPRAQTAPRQDVIDAEVAKLERRGFEIRRAGTQEARTRAEPPVEIDTRRRIVTVRPEHGTLRDKMTVAGNTYTLAFDRWDYRKARYKACRPREDGSIEINQDYPLFEGAHKDIFRRLQILLLEAELNSTSKRELFDSVQQLLLQEFDGG